MSGGSDWRGAWGRQSAWNERRSTPVTRPTPAAGEDTRGRPERISLASAWGISRDEMRAENIDRVVLRVVPRGGK